MGRTLLRGIEGKIPNQFIAAVNGYAFGGGIDLP